MSDQEEESDGFDEPTAPAWMATFGDLMSLLLTFFVLLMSFASMDSQRFAAVVGSMRDAFGVQRVHPGHLESLSTSLVRLSDTESTPYMRVIDVPSRLAEHDQSRVARIQMSLQERKLERVVQVEATKDGVVVRVPGELLFDPGSADMRPAAIVLMREIAELIEEVPGDVVVAGHTDASPAGSGGFKSNWGLSSARAVAALVHLVDVENVDPMRLRATGFGSTRSLEAGNPASERRVEFVFLRERPELQAQPEPESQKQVGSTPAPSNEG